MQKANKGDQVIKDTLNNLDMLFSLEKEAKEQSNLSLDLFFEQNELKKDAIITPGILLIHLYGLIVYPWENLKRVVNKNKNLQKINPQSWGEHRYINISPRLARRMPNLKRLLEIMRNALSHACVQVDDDLGVTFWDREGTKVYFTFEELRKFIRHFYEICLEVTDME